MTVNRDSFNSVYFNLYFLQLTSLKLYKWAVEIDCDESVWPYNLFDLRNVFVGKLLVDCFWEDLASFSRLICYFVAWIKFYIVILNLNFVDLLHFYTRSIFHWFWHINILDKWLLDFFFRTIKWMNFDDTSNNSVNKN